MLLYEQKRNAKYFVVIGIMSATQLLFWGYLSYFALIELNGIEKTSDEL